MARTRSRGPARPRAAASAGHSLTLVPGLADPRAGWLSGWTPRSAVTFLGSIAGLFVTVYLTYLHFQPSALVCPLGSAGSLVDCAKVVTSPESSVFGIPVPILGLGYFVPMLVLSTPRSWRSSHPLVAPARLSATVVSMGFVCYLIYAELYEIHAICFWCSIVHALSFMIFVAVATGWDEARSGVA